MNAKYDFNMTLTFFFFFFFFFPIEPIGYISDKSRYHRSSCIRARLMTLHVNIYFCRRPLQNSHWKTLQQCRISFLYHVRIEIIFLYRDLSLINAWCCRADANINSPRLRGRELILRKLPSNIICQSRWMTVKKKKKKKKKMILNCKTQSLHQEDWFEPPHDKINKMTCAQLNASVFVLIWLFFVK